MSTHTCPTCDTTTAHYPGGVDPHHHCEQIQAIRDELTPRLGAEAAQQVAESICRKVNQNWSRAWTDDPAHLGFMAIKHHTIVEVFANEIDEKWQEPLKRAFDLGYKYAYELLTPGEVRERARRLIPTRE